MCVCVCTGRQVDGRGAELTQELCEQGVGQGSHSLSRSSHVHNRLMVSVDVNHRGRRRRTTELRSCVNREVGLGSHSLCHSSHVPDTPYGFCGTWMGKYIGGLAGR